MEVRPFGETGFQISAMGYGCGGYWGMKIFDETVARQLVLRAIEGGVTFFDTGASYSGGNAEKRLGRILKGIDTSKLIIGTKAGTVIRNGRLSKDYSPASIEAQAHESLENLGLERLPLLQLHGVPMQRTAETFEALRRLKKQGKVALIGASCDDAALEHALSFGVLDVVMLTYNLIEKHALAQIEKARACGCGILIKSPLAHTLYSGQIFKVRRLSDVWYLLRVIRNYRSQLVRGQRYRFINSIPNWAASEIALLYALHESVSCVVTGTTSLSHMEANLAAFEKRLPPELRARIDRT